MNCTIAETIRGRKTPNLEIQEVKTGNNSKQAVCDNI